MDAVFLTKQHYNKDPFSCPLFGGCDEVTNSMYSEIFGIPVSLLGVVFYASIFLLSLLSYLLHNKKLLTLASMMTPFGFLSSAILVSLMLFVIKAVCFYCVLSAISSTLLFVLGMIYLYLQWRKMKISLQKESGSD